MSVSDIRARDFPCRVPDIYPVFINRAIMAILSGLSVIFQSGPTMPRQG
jgi:hypothetical protein